MIDQDLFPLPQSIRDFPLLAVVAALQFTLPLVRSAFHAAYPPVEMATGEDAAERACARAIARQISTLEELLRGYRVSADRLRERTPEADPRIDPES